MDRIRLAVQFLLAALIVAVPLACSGDGDAPTGPAGSPPGDDDPVDTTASVTITLGLWPAPDETPRRATPPEVSRVTLVIRSKGEDVVMLEPGLAGADRPVRATLDLDGGAMTRIEARAFDDGGTLRYRGTAFARVTAPHDSVLVSMAPGDDLTPPAFAGLAGAVPDGSRELRVDWALAGDDTTDVDARYLVYVAPVDDVRGHDRRPSARGTPLPRVVVEAGATSWVVDGLDVDTAYEVRVEAIDRAGNPAGGAEAAVARTTSSANERFVDASDGADVPGCGSEASPCRSLSQGLAGAPAGVTIRIAPGLYAPDVTGEVHPTTLPPRARVLGSVDPISGRPRVEIEAGDAWPVFLLQDEATLRGLEIRPGGASLSTLIDARDADLVLDRVHVVGEDVLAPTLVWAGREAVIRGCRFVDVNGPAVSLFGDDPVLVTGCRFVRCQVGVGGGGRNVTIAGNRFDDCVFGVAFHGIDPGVTGDLDIRFNWIEGSANALDLKHLDHARIVGNVLYRASQLGALVFNAEDVRFHGNHIDGCRAGIQTNVPVEVRQSTLVCNDVGIYVYGGVQSDVRYNAWNTFPPTIAGIDGFDEPWPEVDICYDRDYTITPEPLWSPNLGAGSCLVVADPPGRDQEARASTSSTSQVASMRSSSPRSIGFDR